jgi:hypothetical protein
MSDNKERADDLLTKIGEVSRIVGEGLRELDEAGRSIAGELLKDDLKRYER